MVGPFLHCSILKSGSHALTSKYALHAVFYATGILTLRDPRITLFHWGDGKADFIGEDLKEIPLIMNKLRNQNIKSCYANGCE